MKKFVYLFLGTAVIISAIFMSGYFINNNITDVQIYTLKKRSVDNIVNTQGKLQYGSEKGIYVNSNCIINEIFVEDGDIVKKDDKLFTYYEIGEEIESLAVMDYSTISELSSIIEENSSLVNQMKNNTFLKTMYSKYDGTVSGVTENGYAVKNTNILKVTDKSSLEILVNINETEVSKIELNQKVKITFTAADDKIFTGTVTYIAEEAKQTTGLTGKETTVEVMITLDEKTEEMRVGYTATCSIVTSTDDNVLIIPYECIRSDNNREYVYVFSNGKAIKKYVETDKEYKDGVLLKSGLKDNDVLIKNCDTLHNGQIVSVIDGEI